MAGGYKLQLLKKSVMYLGHDVEPGKYGLKTYGKKLLEKLPEIGGRKSLQKALGMMNLLKPHVVGFSEKCGPFYDVVKEKGRPENWSELNREFKRVVSGVLKENKELAMLDEDGSYGLYTDWSSGAVGYVLTQGKRIVELGSCRNQGWHSKCSSHLGETYSLVWALKHVYPIVRGCQVRVYTDSQSLTERIGDTSMWEKEKDVRMVRMLFYLQTHFSLGYELTVTHLDGVRNELADLLSRWSVEAPTTCMPAMTTTWATRQGWIDDAHRGHFSADTTWRILQRRGQDVPRQEVDEFVKRCIPCQKFRMRYRTVPWGCMDGQFDFGKTLGMDAIGPLPESPEGYKYLLTLIDHGSRYPMALPVRSPSSTEAIRLVTRWVGLFGRPENILTDNARAFRDSRQFREWAEQNRIGVDFTPPYAHKSAGMVERLHRVINDRLRKLREERGLAVGRWVELMPDTLQFIRDCPSRATGATPRELMMGVDERGRQLSATEWTRVRGHAIRIGRAQRQKRNAAQLTFQPGTTVGDWVWVWNHGRQRQVGRKLQPYWAGPFEVTRVISEHRCEVRQVGVPNARRQVQHQDFLLPYVA